MNNSRYPHLRMLMAGLLLCAAAFTAMAAETVVMQPPLQYTATSGDSSRETRVQSRFIGDFGEFAGSDDNARSLYSGLRNGSQITLASTTTSGGGATGTVVVQFEPPTRPMGNGNVFISAALARQQLAAYGITNPTPQQLQAALTGGTIVPVDATAKPVALKGILVQRADGMGWGSIAKASGTNLGKVVSGLNNPASANTAGSTTAGSSVTTAGGATMQSRSGTTAAGVQAQSTSRGQSAYTPSRGIVTATGGSIGAGTGAYASAQAGRRAGAGFATGNGVSARGSVNAQGQGKGLIRQ